MAGQYENKKVAVQNMMYDQCMNGGFGRDTCVCVAQKADITSGNTINNNICRVNIKNRLPDDTWRGI